MPDTDPVCGMTVDARVAVFKVAYGKFTFYFCSHKCMEEFTVNPAKCVK